MNAISMAFKIREFGGQKPLVSCSKDWNLTKGLSLSLLGKL
jgi:hypothetical protein